MRKSDEKKITRKRNNLKDTECIARILAVYVLGIIISSLVLWYDGQLKNEHGILETLIVLIWTCFCLAAWRVYLKIEDAKEEKVTSTHGRRMLVRDIRRNEGNVVVTVIMFLCLVWLSINEMLVFEEIFLSVSILPILVNVKLVKCFENQKQDFNYRKQKFENQKYGYQKQDLVIRKGLV